MAVDQSSGAFAPDDPQLTSVRVPLDQAADAFVSPDASGRTPIVVLTSRQNRIGNVPMLMGVVILVGGILWGLLAGNFLLISAAVVLGLVFFVLAIFRSFLVRIPEGTNGLLQQRGKYLSTIESGTRVLPPWIVVSHLVTRRIIPFDVPVQEAPTQDNVRASVQALVTFTISDPYHFVYSVSASDFDQVFQAACQNAMRAMVRQISSDEVNNLPRRDTSELRETLSTASESYGVKIVKVTILYARPPEDFVRSQEARQLAMLQQVDREHEELQLQIQQAEARRRVVELEAEAEELRLAKLQDRLHSFPQAAEWEWQGEQLEVARGLASNTHAVVQLGSGGANDIARAFLLRDVMQGQDTQANAHSATPERRTRPKSQQEDAS